VLAPQECKHWNCLWKASISAPLGGSATLVAVLGGQYAGGTLKSARMCVCVDMCSSGQSLNSVNYERFHRSSCHMVPLYLLSLVWQALFTISSGLATSTPRSRVCCLFGFVVCMAPTQLCAHAHIHILMIFISFGSLVTCDSCLYC